MAPHYDTVHHNVIFHITWPRQAQSTGGRLNKKDGLTRYGDCHVKDKTSYRPGGRLNMKDRLTGYGDPHVKDKTSYRPSYL